ncbi:MAG TPA: type I methionyl aminopeptidase [Bacillota bacterium]|nr:type I methionyl aminopeptidase [Bacillota bacterium]
MVICKSPEEIDIMKKSGAILAELLDELRGFIKPGITTSDIDAFAEEFILSRGANPSFKGLYGFPASACVSVNEEVVHGIPGNRKLVEGDIVSIDVGAEVEGFHCDSAMTFPVGRVSSEAMKLIRTTEESLYRGIEQARIGMRIADISRAIQSYAESRGFSIIRALSGHGVGRKLHEEPAIPNFVIRGEPGPVLADGMTLAIEPMVNVGGPDVKTLNDNWTVVTCDGSLSAHFEHSVAVTCEGPVILTAL